MSQKKNVSKDGYIYWGTDSHKAFPKYFDSHNQTAKIHQCKGRLICENKRCDMLQRHTVMNSVPNKSTKSKSAESKECIGCGEKLHFKQCNGTR